MHFLEKESIDLSIIMPCLNEGSTVGICVDKALSYINHKNIEGEVIVVDNGSDDASSDIASEHGASVITELIIGYGAAIRRGISGSRGKVIIIGDCDTTYDFSDLDRFYERLYNNECDIIIGNRFSGKIENGAMPLSHKLGVCFLSMLGRLKYKVKIMDFHSGLRGLTRQAAENMELSTNGMEFATEMIAEASRRGYIIDQTPITLRKCRYDRSSKLRTVRDGIRHLIYMFKG